MNTIKEHLEAGEYRIEHKEECNCGFDWRIVGDEIEDGADGNECWEGRNLMVGEELIAEYIRYEGLKIHACIAQDDLPESILDAMHISDMVEQGESPNSYIHEANRRQSLIDWLTEEGYRLYRDNQQGFGNQYTSIIVIDADADIDPDWEEQSPDQWADDYLYLGNPTTEPYNSVKVI